MMSSWCPMVVINPMNACSGETGMPKEKKHKANTSIPGSCHLFSFLFQLARRAPTSLEADAGQIRCSLDSGRSCCSLKIVTAVIPQSMAQHFLLSFFRQYMAFWEQGNETPWSMSSVDTQAWVDWTYYSVKRLDPGCATRMCDQECEHVRRLVSTS